MSDIEEEFQFDEEFVDEEDVGKDQLLGSDGDKTLNERMSASAHGPSVNGSFVNKTADFDRSAVGKSYNSASRSAKSVSFQDDQQQVSVTVQQQDY